MLFLVLNLTACQAWHSVSLDAISPAQLIEEEQPDRVRVLMRGGTELELERPAVDGDQLVAPGGFSMSLADILQLEVQGISILRTIGFGYGVVGVVLVGSVIYDCEVNDECTF